MSSFTDDTRAFIVNESENRPAMTIAKLGAAVDLIDALEMQLRGWQDKGRVRDTRKGEWPDECQEVMLWSGRGEWWTPATFSAGWHPNLHFWLPAPPPPVED